MDSLGEVGKKMRSAIKAKLLELGTGSQTGYIDDELPDYVMIMVANKRSKSQMTSDLNLFLGSNTESFVNWLHQVLQKLQEVTLPNNLASKAKKKNDVASKKDKKKDKKNKEPSITDVIAVELMEKAKMTLELDPKVKKEGTRTPSPPPAPTITQKSPEPPSPPKINQASESEKEDDEFDIPTISEIATSAGHQNLHKKELSQLQELQNRIYQTKKKLKDLESESDEDVVVSKSSVLSRLGVRKRTPPPTENSKPSSIISLSAIRRSEKEIYVAPSFRKLIERQKVENDRRVEEPRRSRITVRRDRRSKSRSRSRDRQRGRRERSRSPIKRSRSPRSRPSIHQRIGSRIVVASPEREAPIKAKHRPTLSSAITGQAGKNLLLRAVAEAQRSTAFTVEQRKKPVRDNIVVQVPLRKDKRNIRMDEEYVPESLSTQSESEAEYHPFNKTATADDGDDGDVIYLNNNEDVEFEDLDNDEPRKSPQFVVTLEGVKQFEENSKSSHSPTPPPVIKRKSIKDRIGIRTTITREERPAVNREERPQIAREKRQIEEESESQRAYNRAKRARLSPIKFDLTDDDDEDERKSLNSSRDLRSQTPEKMVEEKLKEELNGEKRIKLDGSRSFDHVPSLLSSITVPVVDLSKPVTKSKDRCKFYPLCSNASCAFYHPTLPCKLFPNCKFGDSCAYVHPRCKFDPSCHKVECNFSHSQASSGQTMPPIASSVVPVQNYKSISITPNTTICKFFPICKNSNCVYLHPKICKFGKDCMNKFDCNFYHFELSSKSKFKWVSPLS